MDLILLGTKIDPHNYKVVFHVEFQTSAGVIISLFFGKLRLQPKTENVQLVQIKSVIPGECMTVSVESGYGEAVEH